MGSTSNLHKKQMDFQLPEKHDGRYMSLTLLPGCLTNEVHLNSHLIPKIKDLSNQKQID